MSPLAFYSPAAIPDVIYHTETYGVTTIRASMPMFLMSLGVHPSATASGRYCELKEGEAAACSPIEKPYLTDAMAANFFQWSSFLVSSIMDAKKQGSCCQV
ncbi:hypothetical protein C2845_PM18G13430 [Panicum miliaceum]|uniref:Uncharacterized protein n=1 Tax=Panicum miliaceum TaxID=4540 RepID=A0A3L6PJ87_PANMI|nr:hypothetical protein C2845_PM18G13430 [Panicum miliaceum]